MLYNIKYVNIKTHKYMNRQILYKYIQINI